MEKVGKHLERFSSRPGLDKINFFEMSLFCFITGNADMHLKNFALLTTKQREIMLSPAFDMVCTKIVMPADKEEMALTINAKKRKLKKSDFDILANHLKIPEKTVQNIYAGLFKKINTALEWIDISFLPKEMRIQYKTLIEERIKIFQV